MSRRTPPQDESPPSRGPVAPAMTDVRKAGLWSVAAALLTQPSFKNALWTLVVVGTPVTTAGFVYQVVKMHQERMRQEFVASPSLVDDLPDPELIDIKKIAPSLADERPEKDMRQLLFSMLILRARFVDGLGSDPASLTGSQKRNIRAMLEEDEQMFSRLRSEKEKDLETYLFEWHADEERLSVLHVQLASLAP